MKFLDQKIEREQDRDMDRQTRPNALPRRVAVVTTMSVMK